MSTLSKTTCFALTAFACTSFATAQNDECATASVAVVGAALFDTTTATLSPEIWPCAGGGGPDLWYTYTAPISGQTTISTCGSSYDTALEVFTGTCGALVPLQCNDDTCNFQSSVAFAATMGVTYTFRIGGYMGASGPGTFVIDDGRPRLDPVSGNYYQLVGSPGITWDQARLDAEATSFMGIQGRLVTITSQQENDFVESLGDIGNAWLGGFQNLSSPNYSEPGGGWEWITGEPFNYTNWLPGEPNNTGGFPSEDFLEMLSPAQFGGPVWNDAHPMEHPRGYIIEFADGAIGTNYCSANPNSTGATGSMSASGSVSIGLNNFTIEASDLPLSQFGIFVTSLDQGFVPNGGGSSNGNICLGGVIGRFFLQSQIVTSGSTGEFSLALPLNSFPQGNGFVAVMPGETWNFQAWHRDNVGLGSNFTDGLSVTFQ